MAKPLHKPVPPAPKQIGAPEERREKAFAIYRDMGATRSLRQLAEVLKVKWRANAVSHVTLQAWSKKDEWQKRVIDYDLGLARANVSKLTDTSPKPIDGDVDAADALQEAARQILAGVAAATHVTIGKAGDMKALLEAARMSMDLSERIKQERQSTSTEDEVAAFMRKLIERLDVARRRDYALAAKTAAEAACAEAGTTNLKPVFERVAAALGLRVNEKGEIDAAVDPGAAGSGDDGADALVDDEEVIEDLGSNGEEVKNQVNPDVAMADENSADEMLRRLRGDGV